MRRLAPFAFLILTACAPKPPLPVLGTVPPFQLTDQNGRPFERSRLDGKLWVADFIYTTCTSSCPMMSSKMRMVENRFADTKDLRFVSFTVDPAHDTPPVLADYARHFQALPGRWFFLTGDPQRLNALALTAFHLNSVGGSAITHSTRFVLVDRQGRIRGYYGTLEDDAVPRLIEDIKRLERE